MQLLTRPAALAAGIVVIWLRSYGGHCGPDVGRGERAACVTFSICATACAAIAVASWFVLLLCRRATFERLAMPACMLMWVLVSASSVAAIFDPDGLGLLPTHVWRGEQPAGPGPVIAAYLGERHAARTPSTGLPLTRAHTCTRTR